LFRFFKGIIMSTLVETQIPDQLWQQAQNMVTEGCINNMDALIAEAIRRYVESHQQTLTERFIREDIEWGLHGKD
jgi:hypothetical protein